MQYSILIDNVTAQKWGLNIQEAYVFAWVYSLPSWATSITYSDSVYHFASKNKFITDMPLLTDKKDTVYRYYKRLADLGLIHSIKVENRDYIKLLDKAKEWNRKSDISENNPSSENNPTYSINRDKELVNNKTEVISNPNKLGNEYTPEFEQLWKLYNASANATAGNKLIAYKKFIALSKTKEFRLMFEQSLLEQKIQSYLLDCQLSNRSNKHFSTYLNNIIGEPTYLCESLIDEEIDGRQVVKLCNLFEEVDTEKVRWFLSYITASSLNDKFREYTNNYLNKIYDSQGFKMSFSRFAGTYAKSYKDGEWLNYINK